MRQIAGPALTDERHGNISLNNEQHLFTAMGMSKNVKKKLEKALEGGVNCAFCYVEPQGRWNEGLKDDNSISEDGRVSSLSDAALFSLKSPRG
jgi:hypothetical protein